MRTSIVLGLLCAVIASCHHSGGGDHGDWGEKRWKGEASAAPGTLEDIAENQRVRVRFDDSVYPYAVERLEIQDSNPADADPAQGTIEGAVTAIDATAGTITLLGLKVAVDPSTELAGLGGLGELTAGRHVQIRTAADANGGLRAARLALRPAEAVGIVVGRVPDGDSVKIGVLGRTMVVSPDTEIVKAAGACSSKHSAHDEHEDDDD